MRRYTALLVLFTATHAATVHVKGLRTKKFQKSCRVVGCAAVTLLGTLEPRCWPWPRHSLWWWTRSRTPTCTCHVASFGLGRFHLPPCLYEVCVGFLHTVVMFCFCCPLVAPAQQRVGSSSQQFSWYMQILSWFMHANVHLRCILACECRISCIVLRNTVFLQPFLCSMYWYTSWYMHLPGTPPDRWHACEVAAQF